jgi:GDP-L-fucose synthase
MVGSALVRYLKDRPEYRLITKTRAELDLQDTEATKAFFEREKPELVILAAAKVGGIHANNTYPVEFLLDNLKIQNNIIENAYRVGVKKLVFLGSSCIYPRLAAQPIREDALLTGLLEPTNEAYAIAKIAGIKLCQAYTKQYGADFISVMPSNLYGPEDSFDLENAHVLPTLIHRFHLAKVNKQKEVVVWGTGAPKREFLFVDDLAEAVVMLMESYSKPDHINVGYGEDVTIRELAELVKKVVGFEGELTWDTTKPDGMPRKILDSSRLRDMGWKPKTSFYDGLVKTYDWFCKNYNK